MAVCAQHDLGFAKLTWRKSVWSHYRGGRISLLIYIIKISAHFVVHVDKQFVWLRDCLKSPARQKCCFSVEEQVLQHNNTWKAFSTIHKRKINCEWKKTVRQPPLISAMHL